MAIYFLEKNISPEDTETIAAECKNVKVTIGYEEGGQQVYLNGENITGKLREEAVGNMASEHLCNPRQSREALLGLQRDLAKTKDVVMDGT